jgi:transcriptional regulator with XRE-family HTH domain
MDPNTDNPRDVKGVERDDVGEEEDEKIGKAIGGRVGRLRTQAGISQRGLQLQVGLGHGYLSTLESGRLANPGIAQLYKIALALNVPLARLLTDDEESHETSSLELSQGGTAGSTAATTTIEVDPELEDVQGRIAELWRVDKERFAALRLVVGDMQEKAASNEARVKKTANLC